MKFSYSLQFNAVPEWADEYLSYGDLKKGIRDIETARLEETKGVASPAAGVQPSGAVSLELGAKSAQLERQFVAQFEADCRRVAKAFSSKKDTSSDKVNELFSAVVSDSSSEVAVNRIEVWTGEEESLEKRRATLEDRFNSAYLFLHDLHDFLDLNYTGYVKLVKNFGKYLAPTVERKRELLAKVDAILPIADLSELQSRMGELEEVYGRVMCDGNVMQARAVLHLLLRDRMASSRQSISPSPATAMDASTIMKTAQVASTSAPAKAPVAHGHGGSYFTTYRIISLVASIFVLFGLILIPGSWLGGMGATAASQRTFAILITAIMLWCTEAIPLYATAMLVPFLISVFKVISKKHLHLGDADVVDAYLTSKYIFSSMCSDMIFLLLGGFAIAAAFQKYGITKQAAMVVLKRFGRTSSSVLLTVMIVTMCASALISNVAAPVLSFGLIQPILRNLDCTSPLAQSLILGIAFAANIGGLSSSIASPQSVIGSKYMEGQITFGSWFLISTPIAFISVLACWLWLTYTFPSRETLNFKEIFAPRADEKKHSKAKVIATLAIAAVTLGLWVVCDIYKATIGSLGNLAVVGTVLLFGSGLLGKEDFNGFMWNVVMLAMGGTALGKALESSGLLDAIGQAFKALLGGFGYWPSFFIFCGIILFITTFISHTVGATILLPIVQTFAQDEFPGDSVSQGCLILAACFTCSAGMAMPISGFPNMTAMSQEDRNGRPYLSTSLFARGGVLPSIFFAITIVVITGTLGQLIITGKALTS